MSDSRDLPVSYSGSRRRFLRQSFAFSALAAMGSVQGIASPFAFNAAEARPTGAKPASADLLMIGDWGAENPKAQSQVAAAMANYTKAQAVRLQAFVSLGDNWYGPLPGGAQCARWQTQFEEMYPASVFDCPAYAIPGNHDYQTMPVSKLDAELEYARTARPGGKATRFTMPSRWYRFEFPAKDPLITFIALDSNMPKEKKNDVDFTLTEQDAAQQLAWLGEELKKPRTTPFLVVMGHHPVYSDGPHGDHPVLIKDWDPLFRMHNVSAYLAGHDHDLQHLEFAGHPTSFFLSGGGGADLYNLKVDPGSRGPYAQKVYGFSHLSATSQLLTFRHLDRDGRLLHAFAKTPQGTVSILS
jgi:tartrate-resistant acid phosphatase type 5